jgi:uncharacterized membrane protein
LGWAGVAITLAALAKFPTLVLVLPLAVAAWRRSPVAAMAFAFVPCLLVLVWMAGLANTGLLLSKIDHSQSPLEHLLYLSQDPRRVVSIAYHTLRVQTPFYFFSMVGIFGWLDTPLPQWFYLVVALLLCTLAVGTVSEAPSTRRVLQVALLVAGLAGAAAIVATFYLSYTDMQNAVVEGVQGRYFIPLLFPLLAALAGLAPRRGLRVVGFPCILTLWLLSVSTVPHVLSLRYFYG